MKDSLFEQLSDFEKTIKEFEKETPEQSMEQELSDVESKGEK